MPAGGIVRQQLLRTVQGHTRDLDALSQPYIVTETLGPRGLAAAVTLKCIRCYQRKHLAKLFSASPDVNNEFSQQWQVMTGGESLMYLEGCPRPAWRRPQLAKLSQDRVTLVVEGHSGEFPDGFLKSVYYTPLLFCVRALQELSESVQDILQCQKLVWPFGICADNLIYTS